MNNYYLDVKINFLWQTTFFKNREFSIKDILTNSISSDKHFRHNVMY